MNFLDGYGLYRFDVQTGQLSTWLPYTGSSYSYAFSPDDTYLAYSTNADNGLLHILNLEKGQRNSLLVPDKFLWAAKLLWSPDSNKMIFITLHKNWCCEQKSNVSLYLYNATDNTIIQLISNSSQLFYPVEWISDSQVRLHDYWNDKAITFDVPSKKLLDTPTP